MKNTDWGKLIGRLAAVLLAFEAVQFVRNSSEMLFEMETTLNDKLPYLLAPAISVLFAVLIWLFANRLAPRETASSGSDVDVGFVGAAVVASVAVYAFLGYAYSLIDGIVKQATVVPPAQPPSLVGIVFDIVVCGLCVAVVVQSRHVAEWAAR